MVDGAMPSPRTVTPVLLLALSFVCASLLVCAPTHAQHGGGDPQLVPAAVAAAASAFEPARQRPDRAERSDPAYDPYRHDLRIGLFPAHVMGAWTQTHVGSSARAELDVMPRLALAAWGRLGWARIGGQDGATAFGAGGGLRYFFIDSTVTRSASGTIYPLDPGIPPDADAMHTATGDDLDVPVAQRMGGPQMVPHEVDYQAVVPMRAVHALRLGYDFAGGPQAGRDEDLPDESPAIDNRLHMLHLGWGMGSHWNLPAAATGQRELGFKRGYVDVLVTLPALAEQRAIETPPDGFDASFMPVGVRLGLEGAMDAVIDAWQGLGLAYKIEGGALPGYSGFEAYVYVALGVELDAATGSNARVQARP